MKLSNTKYAGKTLVTAFGKITFDKDGNANVSDEAVEALTKLPGFTTDYTTPADTDIDPDKGAGEPGEGTSEGDSGDGEHAEDDGQDEPQGEADTTQNGDESSENGGEKDDDEAVEALIEEQLKKLPVPSLKKLCKERGLDITGINNKQPLINLLLGQ
ncbi:MAG: SAP domain-containing protein [Lachnospiraceae bacterium]|nr:SAP domain-containing protein [Lachnospiraceae bacterium]